MSEIKLPPYIVPYSNRKRFSRKVRDVEEEKRRLEGEGKWLEAAHLGYVLRNAWWGYKKYKNS